MLDLVKSYCLSLQDSICLELERLDSPTKFITETWERAHGGGTTCVLSGGAIFAKAGVNFSHISGSSLPPAASAARVELSGYHYNALGISVVIHPENPYVPTAHANIRFFIAKKANAATVWWFGGGFDLTPYYGFDEDCKHWHQMAAHACNPFGKDIYPRFKAWCDKYFYIKHRNEARGIGGLFFDDYNEFSFEHSFKLAKSIGDHFMQAYTPIVVRRSAVAFNEREKLFQLYRRGRYVEFNLVYDRGTLFGLQSGGRIESILMSLPPEVHWPYNWQLEKNSAEEKLYTDYLPIREWIA